MPNSSVPAADPAPITVSDPLLSAVAASLDAAANPESAGFLADVVDLINRSPSLLTEVDALDATTLPSGGTAVVELSATGDEGGSTLYQAPVINIMALPTYDDRSLPYVGGSLTAGQVQDITPAGTFVGILAHEIAHWQDAQLGALYAGGLSGETIEQAVATEFASEGKAATSQWQAMSQIEASEASDPLPATLATGNVLFNVTGDPTRDSALLQTVRSLQTGPDAYAADVSYLGSQFWNVAVDQGTYLSTMWTGYTASGARNDLGIDWSNITGFSVKENEDGTLAGCVIRTSAGAGSMSSLTYTITASDPGQQQAQITDSASGALVAEVDTALPGSGQPMQLTLQATGFDFTVAAAAQASVQGDDNRLLLDGQDRLTLAGSGDTLAAASGAALTGDVVTLLQAAAGLAVVGAGADLTLAGDGDSLAASASMISLGAGLSASLVGASDAITFGAGSTLTLAGDADSLSGSASRLMLQGAGGFTISGNQDSVTLSAPDGADGLAARLSLSGQGEQLGVGQGFASLQLSLDGSQQVALSAGAASVSGGSAGTTLFAGAASLDYGGGGGLLVLDGGAATIEGAAAGQRQVVFGGSGGLTYEGQGEYADVVGAGGSCTIQAGSGGGWYGGGSNGNNLLQATGAGTVLQAGGAGDTLTGGAMGGSYLIAASGNETLDGGNTSGTASAYLGSGSDLFVAGSGGSLVQTGAGGATIVGGGGLDQIWGGSGSADLFIAGGSGLLAIQGFRGGTDHLATDGQSVTAATSSTGGTLFTLSSGASIMLTGVQLDTSTAFV